MQAGGFGMPQQDGRPEIWSSSPGWLMYIASDSPWMKTRVSELSGLCPAGSVSRTAATFRHWKGREPLWTTSSFDSPGEQEEQRR